MGRVVYSHMVSVLILVANGDKPPLVGQKFMEQRAIIMDSECPPTDLFAFDLQGAASTIGPVPVPLVLVGRQISPLSHSTPYPSVERILLFTSFKQH